MPRPITPYTVVTYRYLRIAMVAVLVMIAASVVIESVHSRCLLGSVSSYYYTPVRTVFVGALFAFGAALIAYKGHSDEEDSVLNLSGLMAFVVAIVPTVPDGSCQVSNSAVPTAIRSVGVTNNILSLLVAGAVALLIGWAFRSRAKKPDSTVTARPESVRRDAATAAGVRRPVWIQRNWTWLRWVLWVIPVAEVASFAAFPEFLEDRGHAISAVTMVVGLILVMFFNAWFSEVRQEDEGGQYRRRYQRLAVVLILAVATTIALALFMGESLLILLLEFVILGIFVVYWLFQTAELWSATDSGHSPDSKTAPAAKA